MNNNRDNRIELTYELICEAVQGNSEAEELIFDYYEPYIIKLSKVPYIDNGGNVKYMIDEDIYMNLKLKLHSLILGFKIA